MEKKDNKLSEIASVYHLFGEKRFLLGSAVIHIIARPKSDHLYQISVAVNDEEVFSHTFELSEEEYSVVSERPAAQDFAMSCDINSKVACNVARDIFLYFAVTSGLPICCSKEFDDQEKIREWKEYTLQLIHERLDPPSTGFSRVLKMFKK